MKDEDLKSALLHLIITKLIIKNSNSNTGSKITISAFSDDKYQLNPKFQHNTKKIKVVSLPKEDEVIKKEKIEDDRSFAIEATIVRVMKSAQRMHHNELINKVLNQLENFKVKIHMIKKKIDNLIERDIIQRDLEDSNYYLYSTN
jgi:hypothetical protein